jgi:hypothetical protein
MQTSLTEHCAVQLGSSRFHLGCGISPGFGIPSLFLPDYHLPGLLPWDATDRKALLDTPPTLYPDEHGINHV